MASVGLLPALALIVGALAGIHSGFALDWLSWTLPLVCACAFSVWRRRASFLALVLMAAGCAAAGAVLGAHARDRALHPPLRRVLDDAVGGFDIETLGPEGDHDPTVVRAVLAEDATPREDFVSLRADVVSLRVHGAWRAAGGGVVLSVGGGSAADRVLEWRAGRTIEAPVTFRRPARYLNEGVPDFERDLALDGTTLFGSIKSGLLVAVIARGSAIQERAADVRHVVRDVVARRIGTRHAVAGAIVTAVLIGDRTGLPDEVRERLQAAGTYHVIAISGGNIAILAGLVLGLLMLAALPGRAAALVAVAVLLAYSQIATAGPSVWRATLMAVLYLGARLLDHRTAPWQAASVAAAVMVVAHPLDIRDPGFILTFGATVALLEGARRGQALLPARRGVAWIAASIVASLAVEIALLPVSARTFSRVTSAGLLLNLVAVPMMGVAQVAGIVTVCLDRLDAIASVAGWIAAAAASTLVESSRLVDVAPWLTARVPPPGLALIAVYYLGLLILLAARRVTSRGLAALVCAGALLLIAGVHTPAPASRPDLRLSMFDVGQAEAMVVEIRGRALQIDAGGAPFGSGGFDIGARVLAPALWARGIRAVDALLITHGDPDHIGGAQRLLEAFRPRRFWEGIEVARHEPTRELRAAAATAGIRAERRRAGETFDWGGARIRVLHPPEPDWERPRVRNDDSVVLEITYGDVALLLTGDITSEVEREIAPRLTPARIRVLKVAHHGSRTSTSRELLDTWRPQVALISAGRGNTFGHPAPEVIERLQAAGARIYRTDLDGEITLTTDGHQVEVATFTGGSK